MANFFIQKRLNQIILYKKNSVNARLVFFNAKLKNFKVFYQNSSVPAFKGIVRKLMVEAPQEDWGKKNLLYFPIL